MLGGVKRAGVWWIAGDGLWMVPCESGSYGDVLRAGGVVMWIGGRWEMVESRGLTNEESACESVWSVREGGIRDNP